MSLSYVKIFLLGLHCNIHFSGLVGSGKISMWKVESSRGVDISLIQLEVILVNAPLAFLRMSKTREGDMPSLFVLVNITRVPC